MMTNPDPRVVALLESWDWGVVNPIPKTLPLLDLFRDAFPGSFDGWSVVFIQHNLGSTIPMVRAFVDSGVPIDRVWHIDIPYSTGLLHG